MYLYIQARAHAKYAVQNSSPTDLSCGVEGSAGFLGVATLCDNCCVTAVCARGGEGGRLDV